MKDRALFAVPLCVALALHAWGSGAYAQDAFVLAFALAAVPLGGRVSLGKGTERAFGFASFVAGGAIGWSHVPELGYGPGTVPRAASLIAVGALLCAVSRLFTRGSWAGEQGTFVLGTMAVAASGTTRLGPVYAVFAGVYVVTAFVALRVRDPAHARPGALATRYRVAFAFAVALSSVLAFGLTRAIPPLHDSVQRAIERRFVMHDMVGFGAGSSLEEMRDMIQSDVEVLRVAPPRGSLPVDYLRGAVYDQYSTDGVWFESPPAQHLSEIQVGGDVAPRGTAVRIHRVAGTKGRYFLPLEAAVVRVVNGAVDVDALGAIFTVGNESPSDYSFVLRPRDKLAPAAPSALDLRIPRNERDRLGKLAVEWTAGAATDEDRLDAIALHLARDYHYSLSFTRDGSADPLLEFLFKDRVGYCTYFASAMALLGRASGVHTRLATGYRVAEWSPISREYVVREKNAHAWVEAWVNGAWRTYDPTPTQGLAQDTAHVASLAILVTDGVARIEEAVAYGLAHVTLAQLFGTLGILASMWVGVRRFRNRTTGAVRERGDGALDRPLSFYASLASHLEKTGIARDGSEPLERFARRLEGAGLVEAARLVDRYAALRYGGVGDAMTLQRDVERFTGGRAT